MKGALPKNGCKPQFLTWTPTGECSNASKQAWLAKAEASLELHGGWVLINVLMSDSTGRGVASSGRGRALSR